MTRHADQVRAAASRFAGELEPAERFPVERALRVEAAAARTRRRANGLDTAGVLDVVLDGFRRPRSVPTGTEVGAENPTWVTVPTFLAEHSGIGALPDRRTVHRWMVRLSAEGSARREGRDWIGDPDRLEHELGRWRARSTG